MKRALPKLRQDPLWGCLIQRLACGHWQPLSALAASCGVGVPRLHHALRDYRRRGAPLQRDVARGLRMTLPLSPLVAPRARLLTCFETDSTHDRLLQALRQGLDGWLALAAEQQTRGRGRRGRVWRTPLGGGIALSLAWPYASAPADALPLRIGVALAWACARLGVRDVRLKWPNDLLVEGRKLGGVLIEGSASGFVIGVGLNHTLPRRWPDVGQPVTSLRTILGARVPPRARVLEVVLEALLAELRAPNPAWQAAFARRDALAGRRVRIDGAGETWEGVACGVTQEGALRVQTPQGLRLCHAGEVSVRAQA